LAVHLTAAVACTHPAAIAPASYRIDGLVVESAPPLDPEVARALAPFTVPSSTRLLDVSDDGHAALIITHGEVLEVRDGRTWRRISNLDVNWARFTDHETIVVTADHDGDENYQLYHQVIGGDPSPLGSGRHADAIVDRARGHVLWASNKRNGFDDDLWLADIDGTGSAPIYTGGGQWSPVAAADGIVLAKKTISTSSSILFRIERQRVVPLTGLGAVGSAVIAPSGEIYAIVTNGLDHLGIYAIRDREMVALTPDLAWDVTAIAISEDGKTIAFVANEDARSVLYLLDTGTRQRRPAPNVPTSGVIADVQFAAHANVLGLTFGDARRPRDAYRYDVDSGTLARWDVTPSRAIDPVRLVEPSYVAIATTNTGHVPTLVYRPSGAGPAPVIVQFHGGPEDQWLPRWSGFDQFLLARGYAIVQPNVRGSTGYGAAYARLDDGPRRGDVIADVGAVLDWIASQPDLDARHVVVMGTAYGGFVALSTLATYPDRVRGAIDVVGIADFVSFLAGTSPYRRNERRAEYGDERDPHVRDQLTLLSPLTRARDIRRPLLVAQGARDPRVPADGADRLVAALRDAGQLVWYLRADDEGHGFTRANNRGAFQVIATQFLNRLRAAP